MDTCPKCGEICDGLTWTPLPWEMTGVFWCVSCRDDLWRKA